MGVLRGLEITPAGGSAVEVDPGYELLAEFLSSDFSGPDSWHYFDVREAVEAGLRGQTVDAVVGNAFAVEVKGAESTLTLVHRSNETLTMATGVLHAALDQYAEFMRDLVESHSARRD